MLEDAATNRRLKLVQSAFKAAGAAIRQRLHPLALWDAIRCGGASRERLARGLPAHAKRELGRMLEALQAHYSLARRRLEAAVALHEPPAATAAGSSMGRGASGGRGRGGWRGGTSTSSSRQAATTEQVEGLLARLRLADSSAAPGEAWTAQPAPPNRA